MAETAACRAGDLQELSQVSQHFLVVPFNQDVGPERLTAAHTPFDDPKGVSTIEH